MSQNVSHLRVLGVGVLAKAEELEDGCRVRAVAVRQHENDLAFVRLRCLEHRLGHGRALCKLLERADEDDLQTRGRGRSQPGNTCGL